MWIFLMVIEHSFEYLSRLCLLVLIEGQTARDFLFRVQLLTFHIKAEQLKKNYS